MVNSLDSICFFYFKLFGGILFKWYPPFLCKAYILLG